MTEPTANRLLLCSTATRSPTAPSTPCRSRTSRPRPASRPTRSTGSPRCSSTCCATRTRPTSPSRSTCRGRRSAASSSPTTRPTARRARTSSGARSTWSRRCSRRCASRRWRPRGTRPTTSSRRSPAAPRREGFDVLICTGDRDALQLVSDRVTVLYPRKGVSDLSRMTPEAVRDKYGLSPGAVPRLRGAARRPERQPAQHPVGGGEDGDQVGRRVRRPRHPRRPRRRGEGQGRRRAARPPRPGDPEPPAHRAGARRPASR